MGTSPLENNKSWVGKYPLHKAIFCHVMWINEDNVQNPKAGFFVYPANFPGNTLYGLTRNSGFIPDDNALLGVEGDLDIAQQAKAKEKRRLAVKHLLQTYLASIWNSMCRNGSEFTDVYIIIPEHSPSFQAEAQGSYHHHIQNQWYNKMDIYARPFLRVAKGEMGSPAVSYCNRVFDTESYWFFQNAVHDFLKANKMKPTRLEDLLGI